MIIPAVTKLDELQKKYIKHVYDKKFKFAFNLNYHNITLKIDKDDDWNRMHFISYDEKNNHIIGYFKLSLDRSIKSIDSMIMVNFDSNINPIFSNDCKDLINKIFMEYNFIKIKWSVVVGNTYAEENYDKFIKRYGGRIVGIFKNDTIVDNKLYDMKHYELMREEFITSTKKRSKNE